MAYFVSPLVAAILALYCVPITAQTFNTSCVALGCDACCDDADSGQFSILEFRYIGGYEVVSSQANQDAIVVPPTAAHGRAIIHINGANTYTVHHGGHFTVTNPSRWTTIVVSSTSGSQRIRFQTDCSSPLAIGDIYGSLTLVRFSHTDGSSGTAKAACPATAAIDSNIPINAVRDPTGCEFDSICSALAARGGKLHSISFLLQDESREGDMDVNLQNGSAEVEPYLNEIVREGLGSPTRVEVATNGSPLWAERMYDQYYFPVDRPEELKSYPARVSITVGPIRGSRSTISITTNCGAYDLRVGDVFGPIKVVGYTINRNDIPETVCLTVGSTSFESSSGSDNETIFIVAAVAMGLLILMMLFTARYMVKISRIQNPQAPQLVNTSYSDDRFGRLQSARPTDQQSVGELVAELLALEPDQLPVGQQNPQLNDLRYDNMSEIEDDQYLDISGADPLFDTSTQKGQSGRMIETDF